MALPTYEQRKILRSPFAGFDQPTQADAELFVTQPGGGVFYTVYDATRNYEGDLYNAGSLIMPPAAIPLYSTFSVAPSDADDTYWNGKTFTKTLASALSKATTVIDDSGSDIDDVVEAELASAETSITKNAGGTITALSDSIVASSKLLVPTNTKPFRLFYASRKSVATDILREYSGGPPRVAASWNYTTSKTENVTGPGTLTHSYSTAILGTLYYALSEDSIYVLLVSANAGWSPPIGGGVDTAVGEGTSTLFGQVSTSSFDYNVSGGSGTSDIDYARPVISELEWDGSVPDLTPSFDCSVHLVSGFKTLICSCTFSATLYEIRPNWA